MIGIPNCIHSNRINVLSRTMRTFTNNNDQNIIKIIDTCLNLIEADCIIYYDRQKHKNRFLNSNVTFKNEDIQQIDGFIDHISTIEFLETLEKSETNKDDDVQTFYYLCGKYESQDKKTNQIFRDHGINCIIITPISSDLENGILCAIFKNNPLMFSLADIDSLAFVASIIHLEEMNKYANKKLHYKIKLEKMISEIATAFSRESNENMGRLIFEALEKISKILRANKSFIYQIDKNNSKFIKEFNWNKNGNYDEVYELTEKRYEWIFDNLQKYDMVKISNIQSSDLSEEMKEFLSICNISTFILIPIYCDIPKYSRGVLRGFVGFSFDEPSEEFVNIFYTQMQLISCILSNALRRMEIGLKSRRLEESISVFLTNWKEENRRKKNMYAKRNERIKRSLNLLETLAPNNIEGIVA